MRLFAGIAAAMLILSFALAEERFEKWAEEEVRWIASQAEREAFQALESVESRREFIEGFWKRRDPTPETERNEYKEEYYQRYKYARENFREGMPGWRTDRGRVFLIHGPPDQVERQSNPGGDAYGMGSRATRVIWKYSRLGDLNNVVLIFEKDGGGGGMSGDSRPRETRQQGRVLFTRSRGSGPAAMGVPARYRLVAAGPPSILADARSGQGISADSAFYLEEALRSPGDRLEEALTEADRRERSRAGLRQRITSSVRFDSLALKLACRDFYPGPAATVAVAASWPLRQLEFEDKGGLRVAKVDFIAQVRDGSGALVDELFKSLELRYSGEQWEQARAGDYRYLNEFHLPAGEYQITAVAEDVRSGRIGSASQRVRAEPPAPGNIKLSGVVLSHGVLPTGQGGLGADLRLGDWRVFPEPEPAFAADEKMVLFLQIYNAQASRDGTPQVVLEYRFLKDGQLAHKGSPQVLRQYSDPGQQSITFSSALDLSGLAPGRYQLQVHAIDFVNRNYDLRKAIFHRN